LNPKGDASNATVKIALGTKDIKDLDNPQVTAQSLGNLEFSNIGSPIGTLLLCELENVSIQVPSALVLEASKSEIEGLVKKDLVDDIWIVCQYSIT